MDPEKINKLFDISETISTDGTANEKGTGLGLLLCKDFVEKHGCKIWVESEEKVGSTFFINLPRLDTSQAMHTIAAATTIEPTVQKS